MVKKLSPDPDLEDLIRKLNLQARKDGTDAVESSPEAIEGAVAPMPMAPPATVTRWPLPRSTDDADEWLGDLLTRARQAHASDLLLAEGAAPTMRVNGRLQRLGKKTLSGGATTMLCAALVPRERRDQVQQTGSVDFSFRKPDVGRFRCNVHRERGYWSAAVRLLPEFPPDLQTLNLPDSIARFSELEYGLVLVTGPTGCGKSTTLAGLIRRLLSRRRVHLITIEDPVEYEHEHAESLVEHIEIGRDVGSFAEALRSVLRQDPDVLLIGEMRDRDSMSIAITAAETGHLVFSTLHTGDAPQTIHRILDSYPANQMDAVRAQLSVSLAGIVSQQLLPRMDDKGRVPAAEILIATNAVRNLVRRGRIEQLRSQIILERQFGMVDLDRSLAWLVRHGLVDEAEARPRARSPEEFESVLNSMRGLDQ
jgi:twitching motility protein PilT